MFYSALLLLGMIALDRLKINLFPDIVFPRITILTPYPDVSPDEIENLISKPVEDAVSSVNGVKKIVSRSEEGLSSVEVHLEWGTPLDLAIINLRQKLDLAKSMLPQDAGKSIIVKFDPSSEPIILLMAEPGRIPFDELRDYIEKDVRPFFERIEGVATVSVLGGRKREISVDLDQGKLQAYGLTVDQIARSLTATNYNYPAGNVKSGEKEFTVRFMGQFQNITDIGNVVVGNGSAGDPVELRKVANVVDGYKESTGSTFYNGKASILVGLKKEPEKNTITTAQNIKEQLVKINAQFGENVHFVLIHDSSIYISEAIASVKNAAILGGCIAFMVLFLFLQDIKSAVIIAVSIPVSIVITFLFMYIGNVSLNIMSLGGLSLGTGMLVDNSIVALEAIQYEIQHSLKRSLIDNVITGIQKVSQSILASTLTSIVIFLPIIFVSGIAGQVFRDLAFTVSFSLVSSLMASLTLIPMLSTIPFENIPAIRNLITRINRISRPLFSMTERLLETIKSNYLYGLNYAFDTPRHLFTAAGILTVSGAILFFFLDKSLFPDVDSGIVSAEIDLPEGTTIEDSEKFHKQIHNFIRKNNLSVHTVTNIGYDSEDIASLVKGVKKPNHSENFFYINLDKLNSEQFKAALGEGISLFNDVQKNLRTKGDPLQEIIGEASNQYIIEIESKKREIARETAKRLIDKLLKLDHLRSLRSSVMSLDPEIKITVDREKLASSALYPRAVGETIQTAIQGSVPTILRENEREIDIRIRLRREDRDSPEKIRNLMISGPNGSNMRLGEFIQIEEAQGYAGILRENQRRLENIVIEYDGDLDEVRKIIDAQTMRAQDSSAMKESIPDIRLKASNQETIESLQNLVFAFLLSIILIYQLLAAQFESLIHPLTLGLSIPMMLAGVSFALFFTGHGINISSSIGMILLVGIVVNSAIVLYEFIQQEIESSKIRSEKNIKTYSVKLRKIITNGCETRLRPILLTTFTTLFGMIPMAVSFGSRGSLQAPMAVVVIGGLLVSTVLTLLAFPVLFYTIEVAIKKRMKNFSRT